jgi:hypothetical protein
MTFPADLCTSPQYTTALVRVTTPVESLPKFSGEFEERTLLYGSRLLIRYASQVLSG